MASRGPGRKASSAASTRPRKRRRPSTSLSVTPSPTGPWVFPLDVVLEIVTRSDITTLIRCAALCKSLRRDILNPLFLGRVTCPTGCRVPPCILGYLHTFAKEEKKEPEPPALFSLVHPCGLTFSNKHFAPFLSRSAADLLGRYEPVTTRGGLVVLRRRSINWRKRSERRSDMCVYNPMTGGRTFFSKPPDIGKRYYPHHLGEVYVLLTAADGIDCSFMLLAADFSGFSDCSCSIGVQIMSSNGDGTWAPADYVGDAFNPWAFLAPSRNAVVLHGGLIHWLANCDEILTYDVCTLTPGSIKLPITDRAISQLHLGKSPEGRLRLLVAVGFIVLVYLLSSHDNAWDLRTVMDTEDQLRLLDPEIPAGRVFLHFRSSGERAGAALLRVEVKGCPYRTDAPLIVLDVETGNMQIVKGTYWDSLLVELDLPTR